MEHIFTEIYETKLWGDNYCPRYSGSSGIGSDIDFNKDTYVPFLKKFIIDHDIRSIVDLGCGDFRIGRLLYNDLNITYHGYDTYKKVIDHNAKQHPGPKYSFTHLDLCNNKERIITGDLCILKDVIQHWSLDHIYTFLDYIVTSKKFKYILICNCRYQTEDDTDIADGGGRPLSCDYFPLKKYNPIKLYEYQTKEVSFITIND
jgi:hypothetical protein